MNKYTRAHNHLTGDVLFDQSRSSWKQGNSNAELICLCLRTAKGSCAADPDKGIDFAQLDNARTNAAAGAEREIRRALGRYSGRFTLLNVTVEVQDTMFLWQVQFTDKTTSKPQTVSGQFR